MSTSPVCLCVEWCASCTGLEVATDTEVTLSRTLAAIAAFMKGSTTLTSLVCQRVSKTLTQPVSLSDSSETRPLVARALVMWCWCLPPGGGRLPHPGPSSDEPCQGAPPRAGSLHPCATPGQVQHRPARPRGC